MSILNKIFRKAQIPHRGNLYAGGSIPSDFTRQDYLQSYASIGWWHAVVFRIALGLSEVKWTLSDVSTRDKPKQIYEHPLLNFLHLINPFQTSEEFIALDTIYMECIGESFWVLNNNALGEPAEAILPYPQKMSVVPAKAFPFVKGYVYGNGPEAMPLDVNEVIHFKFPNPLNQYRGLGQAQPIGTNLDAEQNSDKWVNQFFYNSARPDGVIQFDYNLSDEQFDKLKRQWQERHEGVAKAHRIGLLEGGGKYVQIQNSVKDMDFPNLKLKNRDIILGVEGMPQSVMGISENVNKANAEAGDYTFARWIVKPRLDWKLAKLQEQLIPKFRNSKNLKLGYEEVVPETIDQKRELAESGMRAGYLTINEARKLRGLDSLPDGDVLLIPLNLIPTPIEDLGKPPTPPEMPTESPEETPEQPDLAAEFERELEEVEQESYKGGEGSGNFGHEGRPGEVGGSGEGGGGGGKPSSDKPKPSGGDGGSSGAPRSMSRADSEKWSKENFSDVKFSDSESRSVNIYKSSGSLNPMIREGRLSSSAKEVTDNLDKAIGKVELPESVTVYRGVGGNVFPQGNMTGTVFSDKAYVSSSFDRSIGERFARISGSESKSTPTLMEVTLPKGTKALPMHITGKGVSSEAEIVLGRKTKFKITSDVTKGGKRYIKAEVVK